MELPNKMFVTNFRFLLLENICRTFEESKHLLQYRKNSQGARTFTCSELVYLQKELTNYYLKQNPPICEDSQCCYIIMRCKSFKQKYGTMKTKKTTEKSAINSTILYEVLLFLLSFSIC